MVVTSSTRSGLARVPRENLLLASLSIFVTLVLLVKTSSLGGEVFDEVVWTGLLQETGSATSESISASLFNLTDPEWPWAPPSPSSSCRVVFRPEFRHIRLCHVVAWGANFGDEIGPAVTKRILELYFGCSTAELNTLNLWDLQKRFGNMNRSSTETCLMTVGSMFRMIQTDDHLWGTGVAYEPTVRKRCQEKQDLFNLTVYSSRGPRSGGYMRRYCPFLTNTTIESAGDPAVLIPYIFPEFFSFYNIPRKAAKPYCVIPHHYDSKHADLKSVPKTQILGVQRPWENMTLEMLNCGAVLSSSLHGVIVAEALGIPSQRVRLSPDPGDFKFADFYQSFRGKEPKQAYTVKQGLDLVNTMQPLSPDKRDSYARRVLKTFPIHLFTTEKVSPVGNTQKDTQYRGGKR